MKKLLTIALLTVALAGCTSHEVTEKAVDNGRFEVQVFYANGAPFQIITDKRTGREYLSRYQGGIIELNPVPRQ